MRTNINQTMRRSSAGLLAGLAALSFAFATAAVAPAAAGAMMVDGGGAKKCTPGDIKTVNGKKYVCNKNGKWVHVLSLVATVGGSVVPGATTGPTVMAKDNGSGGTQVTCPEGGQPGDTVNVKRWRNGKVIQNTNLICGKDGQWHTIARLGGTGGTGLPSGKMPAHAVMAKDKGGSQQVTCGDGSKPGDTDTIKIYVNGKLVGSASAICGKDGQWHQVARIGPIGQPRPGPYGFAPAFRSRGA